jgi:hypothetical protein
MKGKGMEASKPRPTKPSEETSPTPVVQPECFEVPSIIDTATSLAEDEETAEAFMYAFNSISKGYFQQKNNIEDTVSQKTLEKSLLSKYYYLGFALLALSLILTAVLANVFSLAIAGIAVIEIIAVYWKRHSLGTKITTAKEELQLIKIDKKIAFVTKLYLPVYLTPYRQGVMIFDSLGRTPTEELHLDNLAGDELKIAFDRLHDTLSKYETQYSDKGVLSAEEVQTIHPNVATDRCMEKPIVSLLSEIVDISKKLEPHLVSLNIYRPETSFANSIHQLFISDLVRRRPDTYSECMSSLPLVETKYDFESTVKAVESIRGMRTQAQEQDIVSNVTSWLGLIQKNSVLDSAEERLKHNIASLDCVFQDLAQEHKMSIFDFICKECAKPQRDDLGKKYKLFTTFEDYLGDAKAGFETLEDYKHLEEYEQHLQEVAKEVDMDVPDDVIYGLLDYKGMKLQKEGKHFKCPSCSRIYDVASGELRTEQALTSEDLQKNPEEPACIPNNNPQGLVLPEAKGNEKDGGDLGVSGQDEIQYELPKISEDTLDSTKRARVINEAVNEASIVQIASGPIHDQRLNENAFSVIVPKYMNVFARTASIVFDYLKAPVIESLKGTSGEINQHYLSVRDQLLALLPLYDLTVQLKVKSQELESAISEARTLQAILRSLRR